RDLALFELQCSQDSISFSALRMIAASIDRRSLVREWDRRNRAAFFQEILSSAMWANCRLVPKIGTCPRYARSQSEVLRRKSAQSESSVCPGQFRLGGL